MLVVAVTLSKASISNSNYIVISTNSTIADRSSKGNAYGTGPRSKADIKARQKPRSNNLTDFFIY